MPQTVIKTLYNFKFSENVNVFCTCLFLEKRSRKVIKLEKLKLFEKCFSDSLHFIVFRALKVRLRKVKVLKLKFTLNS